MDLSYTDEEREYWHARHNERPLDLGHGVRGTFTQVYGDETNQIAGLHLSHIHDDGMVCEGHVTFDLPINHEKFHGQPMWTLHSLEPLTISPSVLQRPCGLHGFIREGKWVPV